MERYTRKDINDEGYELDGCGCLGNYMPINDAYPDMIDKLGELEDIEEYLCCPLDVREQAFKKGFYDENGNHHYCEHYVPFLKQMHTNGIMRGEEKRFNIEDYKKTWWLKEDRSE